MLKNVKILPFLAIILLLTTFIFSFNIQVPVNNLEKGNNPNDMDDIQIPKINAIYEEPSIYIDDADPTRNWTIFANAGYPWFSGSGIKTDAYVIDNVLVTSGSITIRNSNAHFRIQNCEGPIVLRDVFNGKLDNNNCSYIFDVGIILENSDNNEITNNILNHNKDYGLQLDGCNNNTIFGNTANYNGYHDAGILISGDFNIVEENTASYNDQSGIDLWGYNNTVIGNTVEQNTIGIDTDGFNTIEGNTAFNNSYAGIFIGYYGYNNITGNFVNYNGEYGIYVFLSENDTIANNRGYNNVISGIRFESVDDTTAFGNAMYGCGYQFEGSQSSIESIDINISNLVNDKPLYFYVNQDKLTATDFNNAGQVTMVSCRDSIISNLDVSNGTTGITLMRCTNNSFKNIVSSNNNLPGIYLKDSINNTIEDCTINENGKKIAIRDGILVKQSDNNTFSGNTVNSNGINGIYIESGEKNTIFDNTANYNRDAGIYTYLCIGNSILENNVHDNGDHGIHLHNCVNSTVKGNTATHHQLVVCDPNCHFTVDQYGFLLESSQYCNVTENDSSENEIGIALKSSSKNYVFKNHIDADLHNGIWLYYSDNNILLENLIENVVPFESIELVWSNNNTIKKNELRDGGGGIDLGFSNYNQILENKIDMSAYGVTFHDSNYNLVMNNTIQAGWACFEERGDCIGNSFINNSCEEGFNLGGGIPGYDLLFLVLMISIASIFLITKQKSRKTKF